MCCLRKFIFSIIVIIYCSLIQIKAQPLQLINDQGKLMICDTLASGSYSIKFSIYNAENGGTIL